MVRSMVRQRFVAQGVVGLAALLLVGGYAKRADAANILIDITAVVESVFDPENMFGGSIQAGDTITGSYVYRSTTRDSNPAPTVGDYQHSQPPAGIIVYAGGRRFSTDPFNVDFLVEILNNHDIGLGLIDAYLFMSYSNISQPPLANFPRAIVDRISWQLDDFTAMALSSAALPTTPPVLADWESNTLVIEGRGLVTPDWPLCSFTAHVTSAVRRAP